MATQKFKAEIAEKVQELYQFIRKEYPDCDYFTVSCFNHDHEPKEDRLNDLVSMYMTVRPEGTYAKDDWDYKAEDPESEREDGYIISWHQSVEPVTLRGGDTNETH